MENNILNTEVTLSGIDGNVFAIFGACIKSARRNGVPQKDVDTFLKEAKQGDYDHVLQTCHKYFDVY
jgi:hypothetical protein